MHIPESMRIAKWVRQLIREGNVAKFYQSKEWKDLRTEVLEEHFYECQECLKKGIYTRATCVHHVNELKDRPDLAVSKYYVDHRGEKHIQLLPLCNTCHNLIHDKLKSFVDGKKFSNRERW